jgi:rod shape determining protein RodA
MLYAVGYETCGPLEDCTFKYGSWSPFALKQIYKIAFALIVFFATALINIKFWVKHAYHIFALAFIALIVVELVGHTGMGAQRWINIGGFVFQPSEFIKVAMVLALSKYYSFVTTADVKGINALIVSGAIIFLPTSLVLMQPDLGTSLMLVALGAGMLFVSGIPVSRFKKALVIAIICLPLVWQMGLKPYQKERVLTFINPSRDTAGASYHINQSKIALGSGGFTGKGYLNGSQSNLNFLPEKHTDFIFTMFAEEFGFLGSLGLIAIYIIMLLTGHYVVLRSRSRFGSLLAFGLNLNLFLYVFINIAMVMGVIPVVGAPLPIISYGGSALLSLMFGFGLMQNVYIHKNMVVTTSEE